MSGIYGIYQYDGTPVARDCLERMRSAMAYYCPRGGGQHGRFARPLLPHVVVRLLC